MYTARGADNMFILFPTNLRLGDLILKKRAHTYSSYVLLHWFLTFFFIDFHYILILITIFILFAQCIMNKSACFIIKSTHDNNNINNNAGRELSEFNLQSIWRAHRMLRRLQGGNNRRLVYGGIRLTREKWKQTRLGNCNDGTGFAWCGYILPHTTQVIKWNASSFISLRWSLVQSESNNGFDASDQLIFI